MLCNLDHENAPDVIEEMVACLDRETLDENRQFIFADAKERYYEDLFAKGLQHQETVIPNNCVTAPKSGREQQQAAITNNKKREINI